MSNCYCHKCQPDCEIWKFSRYGRINPEPQCTFDFSKEMYATIPNVICCRNVIRNLLQYRVYVKHVEKAKEIAKKYGLEFIDEKPSSVCKSLICLDFYYPCGN